MRINDTKGHPTGTGLAPDGAFAVGFARSGSSAAQGLGEARTAPLPQARYQAARRLRHGNRACLAGFYPAEAVAGGRRAALLPRLVAFLPEELAECSAGRAARGLRRSRRGAAAAVDVHDRAARRRPVGTHARPCGHTLRHLTTFGQADGASGELAERTGEPACSAPEVLARVGVRETRGRPRPARLLPAHSRPYRRLRGPRSRRAALLSSPRSPCCASPRSRPPSSSATRGNDPRHVIATIVASGPAHQMKAAIDGYVYAYAGGATQQGLSRIKSRRSTMLRGRCGWRADR